LRLPASLHLGVEPTPDGAIHRGSAEPVSFTHRLPTLLTQTQNLNIYL
jgi:hypothetical protein